MSDFDRYRTLAAECEGIYREKGSRFIAMAFPMQHEGAFEERLAFVRKEHPSVRHACYAWILGEAGDHVRANDDGEPSGTAGRPILRQLQAAGLTYCGIIVVRYFGGILLGKGGLVRAYASAAQHALEIARTEDRLLFTTVEVSCGYAEFDHMKTEVANMQGELQQATYDITCSARFGLPRSMAPSFVERWRSRGATVRMLDQGK